MVEIVIGSISLFALVLVIYLTMSVTRRLQDLKDSQTNDKGIIMLNQNLQGMSERIDKATESLNVRLDRAAHVIQGVQKELGTVQERFKGFEEFNELLHPKMRGNIGEQVLRELLAQSLPSETYSLQYEFKNGQCSRKTK